MALALCEHQLPLLDGVALLGALGRVRPEILRVLVTPDQGSHVFERATREAEVHYFPHLPFNPALTYSVYLA